jgi:hypothetical protein
MTTADNDAIYRLAVEAKRAGLTTEDLVAAAPPALLTLLERGVPALEVLRELDALLGLHQPAA